MTDFQSSDIMTDDDGEARYVNSSAGPKDPVQPDTPMPLPPEAPPDVPLEIPQELPDVDPGNDLPDPMTA